MRAPRATRPPATRPASTERSLTAGHESGSGARNCDGISGSPRMPGCSLTSRLSCPSQPTCVSAGGPSRATPWLAGTRNGGLRPPRWPLYGGRGSPPSWRPVGSPEP
eukprot:6957414-Lingulodinium_polyedra.AAC.1